ncbi:MAG TPA: hypothetical protein V6D05_11555 [Stenomitos sp.]
MRGVGALVASLLLAAPPGATPPPGGVGPASGNLTGQWEIRFQGLPRGYPARLVMRLSEEQTRVEGEVLVPRSRAFVSGKMLGRFYMVEVRPVSVPGATASYDLELTLDPTSSRGLGTVRARLERGTKHSEATGQLEMNRLETAPAAP